MWKLRKIEEVKKEREKKYRSIKRPLLCSIGVFSLSSMTAKLDYEKYADSGQYFDPISWDEYLIFGLPISLIFSIGTFAILYYWQLRTQKRIMDALPVLICKKCYQTKNWDKDLICTCGGEFIQIDEMEWIEG